MGTANALAVMTLAAPVDKVTGVTGSASKNKSTVKVKHRRAGVGGVGVSPRLRPEPPSVTTSVMPSTDDMVVESTMVARPHVADCTKRTLETLRTGHKFTPVMVMVAVGSSAYTVAVA